MKVILQNAISVTGYIAGPNHNTDWVSEEDWNSFISLAKSIGNVVIGRVTYELMKESGELDNFKDVDVIALTKNDNLVELKDKIFVINKSPQETIDFLKAKGFDQMLIAGGGRLNTSFLNENLIDEMYLDVHPTVITSGTPLFTSDKRNLDLALIKSKNLSKEVFQLHYKVLK